MTAQPQTSRRMQLFFQVVFLVVCLFAGIGLVHEGLAAVRDRAYTLTYTESSSWATESAFHGHASGNQVGYRGGEAVQFGIGFLAVGAMMLAWAVGLGLSLLGHIGVTPSGLLIRALGGASLAGLLVGCLALFPPWRRHTMPLYFVVIVFTLAVTLPISDRLRKKVFPAAVGLVILVGMTGFPAFPIFAGIFVFIMAGTNLLVLWPGLKDRIERSGSHGR